MVEFFLINGGENSNLRPLLVVFWKKKISLSQQLADLI